MDTFSIVLTEKAFADLREPSRYIRLHLAGAETSRRQQTRIKQAVETLTFIMTNV